jgi:hypothetical protein
MIGRGFAGRVSIQAALEETESRAAILPAARLDQ